MALISFDASAYLRFPPQQWSLRWYAAFLSSPDWLGPAALSLKIALATTVSAVLLGGLAAIGLERGGVARRRRAIELFLVSPMVVPVVVLALGLYFLFSGWHILGGPLALWLGHTVIAIPPVIVLTMRGAAHHRRDARSRRPQPGRHAGARALACHLARDPPRAVSPPRPSRSSFRSTTW